MQWPCPCFNMCSIHGNKTETRVYLLSIRHNTKWNMAYDNWTTNNWDWHISCTQYWHDENTGAVLVLILGIRECNKEFWPAREHLNSILNHEIQHISRKAMGIQWLCPCFNMCGIHNTNTETRVYLLSIPHQKNLQHYYRDYHFVQRNWQCTTAGMLRSLSAIRIWRAHGETLGRGP